MTAKKGKAAVRAAIDSAEPIESAPSLSPTGGKPNSLRVPAYLLSRFEKRPDGIYKKSEEDKAIWLCSPFRIEAQTLDEESQGWGFLVSWFDPDLRRREEVIPRPMFSGDCKELRARLAHGGLAMSNVAAARQAFSEYVSFLSTDVRARSVSRVGWHPNGPAMIYVLPDGVIGDVTDRIVLQAADREPSVFNEAGTLAEWRSNIGEICCGNSRLQFYASCGFAAPLLSLLDQPGAGFNLVGKSSIGKSTALRVAASVCGGTPSAGAEGYWRSWRATGNGMEGIAAAHNDTLVCLDEIGSMSDPREAGEVAYMLANGQGKARATRYGGSRTVARWRILFCSTGEVGLADKNAEAGKRTRAGQEVRLIDVPADAGKGMGIFEELHGEASPGDLARDIAEVTRRYYGTPFRAFLTVLTKRLMDNSAAFLSAARDDLKILLRDWMAEMPDAGPQVRNVAARFAIVALAGEMASQALITGWPRGASNAAAEICFRAFLDRRGTVGAREDTEAVAQLRNFISVHGSSRFEIWPESRSTGDSDEGQSRVPVERFRVQYRAGWRKQIFLDNGTSFWRYFLTSAGMKEALEGLAERDARAVLAEKGFLVAGTNAEDKQRGRLSQSINVPNHGKLRLYRVADDVMDRD